MSGARPQVPDGGGTLMWTHVADVARGHVLAMERGAPGEDYMLAGEPSTLLGLLRQVADIAGTPGPRPVPAGLIRLTERVLRPVAGVLPLPASYHESLRASLASYTGTRAKAERELGWTCRSLADGLPETVAALRAR